MTMTITMVLSTLKGALDVLNNEDMSWGDKLLSISTSLGMVLPMAVSAFNELRQAKLKDSMINMLNEASEKRLEKQKLKTAAASNTMKKEQKKETAA